MAIKSKDIEMMVALKKFEEAASQISIICESDPERYDELLNTNYPWLNSFHEVCHEIMGWTEGSINELKNKD